MKCTILFSLALTLAGTAAIAHDEEFRVVLEPATEGETYGPGSFGLDFYLIDKKLEKIVADTDVGSEKLVVHAYDEALGSIARFEATYNPAEFSWHTDLVLPYNTQYWIWAEGTLVVDREAFLGGGWIPVGGEVALPAMEPLTDRSWGMDRDYRVEISHGLVVAETAAEVQIAIARNDGSPAAVYSADLYFATEDGDGLYHVIAERAQGDGLKARFTPPAKGKYRLWVVFSGGGERRQIPLGLTALPKINRE